LSKSQSGPANWAPTGCSTVYGTNGRDNRSYACRRFPVRTNERSKTDSDGRNQLLLSISAGSNTISVGECSKLDPCCEGGPRELGGAQSQVGLRQRAMKPWITSPLVYIRLGTVLAVLGWGLCAPAGVRATCGDYLTMNQRSPVSQHNNSLKRSLRLDALDRSSVSQPNTHGAIPASKLPGPCNGPGCSAPTGPTEPITAPVPVPVKSLDDWAIQAMAFQLVSSPAHRLCGYFREEPAAYHPSKIYHPPRFAIQ
jgi:hypothetical protein